MGINSQANSAATAITVLRPRHSPRGSHSLGHFLLRCAACVTLLFTVGGGLAQAASVEPVAGSPAVSQLEAIHVAEIHTGLPAAAAALETRDGRPVYRIQSSGSGTDYHVEVDGIHGRLLRIDRKVSGELMTTYRWPGIRVVAHRGGVSLGPPENTLPAIEQAIAVHADLIEIDIRSTADGHLVLMHDDTVDRTTNGTGSVASLSLAQIQALEVQHSGAGTIRIPTLAEALRAMRGRIDADLDLKEGSLEGVIRVVSQVDMADQCTMHADHDRCLQVVDREPRIRIRPTVDAPQFVTEVIRSLRPAIINLDWHAVTEQSVRLAHLGGCDAFVNCLGDADTDFYVRESIRIGADYIQSDRPDQVIAILKSMGLRDQAPPRGDVRGTPLRDDKLRYPLR